MMTSRHAVRLFAPLAIVAAAACGRAPVDDGLKNDLALATQAQAFQAQQVLSPAEQAFAANPYTTPVQRVQTVSRAPAPTVRRASAPAPQRVIYEPAPAPQQTVKHTHRDAAIGAAAGAVIGAVSSRDKVKGGLIGAAAGAILGGVIGNNVDISKRPY